MWEKTGFEQIARGRVAAVLLATSVVDSHTVTVGEGEDGLMQVCCVLFECVCARVAWVLFETACLHTAHTTYNKCLKFKTIQNNPNKNNSNSTPRTAHPVSHFPLLVFPVAKV